MAKNLSKASEEYVELVEKIADEVGIGQYVAINVFDMNKSKKDVIKIKKTSVPMEVSLDGEDMIDVYIYEKAFDLTDDETKRIWIEGALSQVGYDMEKGKVILNQEPVISLTLGMYEKYKDVAIEKAELAIYTLSQIEEKEKEEKEQAKVNKKKKRY